MPPNETNNTEEFNKQSSIVEELTRKYNDLVASGNTATNTFKFLSEQLSIAREKLIAIKDAMTDTERASAEGRRAIKNLDNELGGFGKFAVPVFSQIVNVISALGPASLIAGSETLKNLVNPVTGTGSAFAGANDKINRFHQAIQNLLSTQTVARESFIMMGASMSQANEAANIYPQSLRLSAAGTKITTEELHKMAGALQGIPGAIDRISGSFAGLSASQVGAVQQMAVAATVGRGLGFSATESAEMLRKGQFDFNQSVEQTTRNMGVMAAAAAMTGVKSKLVAEQIQSVSEQLAIFGQGNVVAANTWTTFVTTLGNNVPITQIKGIIDGVTSGIANMSTQNRAFISMMSGLSQGKTALGGALELEFAMRSPEGLQKHLQAVTAALSQLSGGKIITLQEAVHNPQLQMSFEVQRQMLALQGLATTKEQQNRVLETLQQVQRGGMSAVDGSKALQEAYAKGGSVQDQQLTSLKKIELYTATLAGENVDKLISGINNAFNELPGPSSISQGIVSQENKSDTVTARLAGEKTGELLRNLPDMIAEFADSGKKIAESGISYVSGITSGASGETRKAPYLPSGIEMAPKLPEAFKRTATIEEAVRPRETRQPAILTDNITEPAKRAVAATVRETTINTIHERPQIIETRPTMVRSGLERNIDFGTNYARNEERKLQVLSSITTDIKQGLGSLKNVNLPMERTQPITVGSPKATEKGTYTITVEVVDKSGTTVAEQAVKDIKDMFEKKFEERNLHKIGMNDYYPTR